MKKTLAIGLADAFSQHIPLGLPKRSPTLLRLFVKIGVLRGSKKNDFAVNDFAKMECRETRV